MLLRSDILTEQTSPSIRNAAPGPRAPSSKRLEPLRTIDAGVLKTAYYEAGPASGPAVMLMHGFPYDIHAYVDVAPQLAARGCRVIVPYLRGYGPTRFRDPATPRSGEQAAMGADMGASFLDGSIDVIPCCRTKASSASSSKGSSRRPS